MTDYLLDTNHASRLMGRDRRIVERIRQAESGGDTFAVSMTIVGELYFAVYASQQRAENLARLGRLLAALNIYPFDVAAAEEFGLIQAEQKAKGRPVPPLDAQIAAVARQRRLTVLTADRHFSYLDNVKVENWLEE